MAGRIALEIEFPDGRRETYRFDKEIVRIGGGSEVEIKLAGLPPLYAVLKVADDRVIIKPTEGAKVSVNGRRLFLPKVLTEEDVIEVGDYKIRVLGVPKPGELENHTPTEFIELPAEIIPRLRVIEGPDQGAEFEVLGTAIVGRDPTTDFTLTDPSVSRHHLKLYFNEDGDVVVEDLGGRNPMLVNGRRVPRKRLVDGDVIQVGKTKILFRYPISGREEVPSEQVKTARSGRWALWVSVGVLGAALLGAATAGFLAWRSQRAAQAKLHQMEKALSAAREAPTAQKARLYAVAESLAAEVAPYRVEELRKKKEFWARAARAESLFAAGAWGQALELLRELAKEEPGERGFVEMAAEAERALALERVREALAGDAMKALALASSALERYPEDPEFLNLYAKALLKLRRGARKSPEFRKLLRAHTRGSPRRVLELADSVLAAKPGNPAALFFTHLAKLELSALEAEAKGKPEKAKALWKLILEIDPQNRLAKRRLK